MSSSPEATALFKLRADAKFPGAAVSIFDGHYGIVAEGSGEVEAEVAAGLYIVQFKAGQLFEKQPVDIAADTTIDATVFSQPGLPAQKLPPPGDPDPARCRLHLSADGEHGEELLGRITILDAARGHLAAVEDAPANTGERDLAVEPGQYLLRVAVEAGNSLEQTVFIPSGWQAQIFFRTDGETVRETDICRWMTNAAILLLPADFEFVGSEQDREAIESALQNLSSNRPFAPTLLSSEERVPANAMLGIINAHVLLRNRATDPALFEQAVQQLGSIMPLHPDVISLKLRAAGADPAAVVFDLPPMLRNSWRIVVEQSANTPAMVPADSWAALAARGMTGVRGWLVWRTPDPAQELLEPASSLAELLAGVRAKISVLVKGRSDGDLRRTLKAVDLDGVEGPLLTYLVGVIRTEDSTLKLVDALYRSDLAGSVYRFFNRFLPKVKLVPKEKILETAAKFIQTGLSEAYVIRNLEVPESTLRSALASLGPKLDAIAQLPRP